MVTFPKPSRNFSKFKFIRQQFLLRSCLLMNNISCLQTRSCYGHYGILIASKLLNLPDFCTFFFLRCLRIPSSSYPENFKKIVVVVLKSVETYIHPSIHPYILQTYRRRRKISISQISTFFHFVWKMPIFKN